MARFAPSAPGADLSLAHRRGALALTVQDPEGRPLADTEVTVTMTRHAFGFGCIGFDFIPLANDEATGAERGRLEALADRWLDVFNACTLPFYWGRFEPVRGVPDTERLRAAARWFVERGVTVKGHPLVWHTVCAPWLADLPVDEMACSALGSPATSPTSPA